MITKVSKEFIVEIQDYELEITVGDYLLKRRKMGIPSIGMTECFFCDTKIDKNENTRLVFIKNQSNKLICAKCYAEIKNGKNMSKKRQQENIEKGI